MSIKSRRGAEMAALRADAQGLDFFMKVGTREWKVGYRREGGWVGRRDGGRKIEERKKYFPKDYVEIEFPMSDII